MLHDKRMIGLDIFRIMAAFVVFLFHSSIHMGCNYGIFQNFIRMGAVFMTGFFMLSGFVLFKTNTERNLSEITEIKRFYSKRFFAILPVYYITAILFILILDHENLKENLFLAPVEILGLQATFNSLFNFSHNGGTWFISCLLICYLIYPYLQLIIRNISGGGRKAILLLCGFILLYAPLIVIKLGVSDIYENPFFRCLEFLIGIVLASLIEKADVDKHPLFFSWGCFFVELAVFISAVSLGIHLQLFMDDYMAYNWIALPSFILMICTLSGVSSDKHKDSRIISYLSSIAYCFFLAQFFTWKTSMFLLNAVHIDNNLARIVTSLAVCIFWSIVLHELVEKPFKRIAHRTALKGKNFSHKM